MAVQVIGVGPLGYSPATIAAGVSLPSGGQPGDGYLGIHLARATTGSLAVDAAWVTLANFSSGNYRCLVYFNWYTGSNTFATVTPSGMSGGMKHMGRILLVRGLSPTGPWLTPGTWGQNASAQNVGPIAAATAGSNVGMALLLGCKLDTWASAATPSGDGLTWTELWDETESTVGNTLSWALSYAPWAGSAPTLTSKTLAITGGSNQVGGGVMLQLGGDNLAAVNSTLGGLATPVAAGALALQADLAATLGSLTAAGAGALAIGATAAVTLGDVALAAGGTLASAGIGGTLAATLGGVGLAAGAVLALQGSEAGTLGAVTLASSGKLAIGGALSGTLGGVTLAAAGSGQVTLTGTLGVTLDGLAGGVVASGALAVRSVLAVTFGGVGLAADGYLSGHGNTTAALAALGLASSATLALAGGAAVSLGGVSLTAGAGVAVGATLGATLGGVGLTAQGGEEYVMTVLADYTGSGVAGPKLLATAVGRVFFTWHGKRRTVTAVETVGGSSRVTYTTHRGAQRIEWSGTFIPRIDPLHEVLAA